MYDIETLTLETSGKKEKVGGGKCYSVSGCQKFLELKENFCCKALLKFEKLIRIIGILWKNFT